MSERKPEYKIERKKYPLVWRCYAEEDGEEVSKETAEAMFRQTKHFERYGEPLKTSKIELIGQGVFWELVMNEGVGSATSEYK